MFTQALHGWILVANSLDVKLPHTQERIEQYLSQSRVSENIGNFCN